MSNRCSCKSQIDGLRLRISPRPLVLLPRIGRLSAQNNMQCVYQKSNSLKSLDLKNPARWVDKDPAGIFPNPLRILTWYRHSAGRGPARVEATRQGCAASRRSFREPAFFRSGGLLWPDHGDVRLTDRPSVRYES